MPRAQFLSADEAVGLIRDGDTVALIGGGGGLMEAAALFAAVERRFLDAGRAAQSLRCPFARHRRPQDARRQLLRP